MSPDREVVGLDIAGIDLVVEDISSPLREQGGAILEVNPMPGFTMHLDPGEASPRPVDDMILELLYPHGTDGRIPIVAVHSAGEAGVARRIHEMVLAAGVYAGITCAAGTFAGHERTRAADCATSRAAADLLRHPRLEAAVFELPEAAIVGEGLPFDRCGVAVCAGMMPVPRGLRLLLQTVEPDGSAFIAHAADLLEQARALCRGSVVGCPGDADATARLAAAAVVSRVRSR